jgi:hypothetical protein
VNKERKQQGMKGGRNGGRKQGALFLSLLSLFFFFSLY